jgi:hypothetical protein
MGNKPGYYEEWYEKNKDELAARRKERYESDPEYRQRVLGASAAYRERQRSISRVRVPRHQKPRLFRLGDQMVPLFSIGAFAGYVNRAIQSINHWEKNGLLPRTPYRVGKRGFRYYSAGMMEVVRQVVGNKKRLFPVDAKMYSRILEGWQVIGVPVGCDDGIEAAMAKTDFSVPQMPPAMCAMEECYKQATAEIEGDDGEIYYFCEEHATRLDQAEAEEALGNVTEMTGGDEHEGLE